MRVPKIKQVAHLKKFFRRRSLIRTTDRAVENEFQYSHLSITFAHPFDGMRGLYRFMRTCFDMKCASI